MNRMKTERLSLLFEKMVINDANHSEQSELKTLYKEFINHDNYRRMTRQADRQVVKNYL